jgi:hypothetical protein
MWVSRCYASRQHPHDDEDERLILGDQLFEANGHSLKSNTAYDRDGRL